VTDEPTRRLDEGAARVRAGPHSTVLAGLVRRGEDFDAAEDALQEALLEALRVWPEHRPRDPGAGLAGDRLAISPNLISSSSSASRCNLVRPRRDGACGYASSMSPPATLVMWFRLRSPELAEDFERLMTKDRDIVRGSLDTVSDWRLTRPADVPGQSIGQADYVLIAEIVEVERFEQQASEHVQRLADDLAHLVLSWGMLVVRPVL
jgi:hypothetical protein